MAKQSTQLRPSGQAMLYNFLLNEILASQLEGSYEFWIVSPWVTNFRLEKPYYVSFQEIVETKQEALHLFDILHQIAANGGKVYITVGSDKEYHPSLRQLSNQSDRIQVRVLPKLHAKAYVGRYGAINASHMGHDLSQIISDLKKDGVLTGDVFFLACRGKSGVVRSILNRVQQEND